MCASGEEKARKDFLIRKWERLHDELVDVKERIYEVEFEIINEDKAGYHDLKKKLEKIKIELENEIKTIEKSIL